MQYPFNTGEIQLEKLPLNYNVTDLKKPIFTVCELWSHLYVYLNATFEEQVPGEKEANNFMTEKFPLRCTLQRFL